MTTTDKPQKTLAEVLGHEPTDEFWQVWRALQGCSVKELNWLKLEGIRTVQRTKVITVEGT